MAKLLPWVKMPSEWITNGGLKKLRWKSGSGANNVAALMVLAPILHRADASSGLAHLTYDQFERMTSLSRSKISAGLSILGDLEVIEREAEGRSTYQLLDFEPSFGWAKFPALRLYSEGRIILFDEIHLRKQAELDALKLWYFFAARRDNNDNLAKVTYDQIAEHTGIARERIKAALSLLAANAMIYVERIPSKTNEFGVAHAYRLPQIDTGRHMGTIGRAMTEYDNLADL